MEEANRFAPPGAQVADVVHDDDVQPVRLWPPSGRLGRLRFLAYGFGLYAIFVAVLAVLGAVAGGMREPGVAAMLMIFVITLVYMVAAVGLMIQRSHDMGLSGWWTFVAFIPLVGLVWVFKGGTRGVNRWGAPPPPNGLGVRIFGLILPIIFGIGVLAAVAIPAYQAYTLRAAAQPQ